jgi:hypothetical protein
VLIFRYKRRKFDFLCSLNNKFTTNNTQGSNKTPHTNIIMGNLHSNAAGTSSHVESSKKHHRKSISGSDSSPRSKSKPTMPSFTKNILFLGLDSAGTSIDL